MLFFPVCFVIVTVSYMALTLWLWRGWANLPEFEKPVTNIPNIPVSIVVPMRNEEQHIRHLLDDYLKQDYPREICQICVVDDHSTDNSAFIVESYVKEYPGITLLRLPPDREGKKAALRHSLPYLTGKLVVTTDADCRLPSGWLSNIAAYYEMHHPAMIICPVIFTRKKSFFDKWQALEMISLTGSAAATTSWEHPIMCSGANLVMEREVMEHHAYIYDNPMVSGDDMMLMMEIKKKYIHRIKYLKSTSATVETSPLPDLKSFIRQRNRWTSKSRGYTDKDVIIVALIVFGANFSIVACLITGFFLTQYLWLALVLWFFKTLVDLPFLKSLTTFWKQKELLRVFLPTQLLYPFYIVWVGIAGNILPVHWKDRKSKI